MTPDDLDSSDGEHRLLAGLEIFVGVPDLQIEGQTAVRVAMRWCSLVVVVSDTMIHGMSVTLKY